MSLISPNRCNTPLTIERIAGCKRLPSLPEVAQRLIEISQQPEPDFDEVCLVIRSDPAISGKILQTINSALFGFRSKIESIEQAAPKLGISMIRTLVLSFHLACRPVDQKKYQVVEQQLWRNFLTQAVFAELLAEKTGNDPATCFMAAMLQDIGILAMFSEYPKDYVNEVLNCAKLPKVVSAERNHFGFSHIDVSIEIMKRWNLGSRFCQAIRGHHDQIASVNREVADQLPVILRAASLGAAIVSSDSRVNQQLSGAVSEWLDLVVLHFDLDRESAEALISEVNERVEEYSLIFNFDIGSSLRAEQVITHAKELLQEIAIHQQMESVANRLPKPVPKDPENNELYLEYLTGLFNRRFINDHLVHKINHWVMKRKPVSMLFMDVDKFKSINDEFGHQVGDMAITHVAQWLKDTTRKSDYAIRLGGDEFLVIMQAKQDQCEKMATRIANEVPPLVLPDDQQLSLSLSVGCVFYQPKRGDIADVNWLIDQADQLMYKAKKNGDAVLFVQKSRIELPEFR